MKNLLLTLTIPLLGTVMVTKAQSQMKRNELLHTALETRTVSAVKVVEIEFQPGQKGPYHRHPCPVVGTIISGTCLLQVEGQPARVLRAGDAFYEPAGTPVVHFDNYSGSEPLKFVAYYLLDGEENLTEFLPERKQ